MARPKNTEKEKKTVKSSKFIKLLAALLCVVMAFVSCSGDTTNTDGVNPDAVKPLSESGPLLDDATAGAPYVPPVYSSLSELYEIKYKNPDYFKEAFKLNGEIEDSDGIAVIMKTSEIGADNLAKEVYSVYNRITGECVLTVENSYEYVNGNKPNEVDVDLYSFDTEILPFTVIVVEKINRTLITDAEKEGNFRFDDSLYYKEETSYEFYDMSGNLFDTANFVSTPYIDFTGSYSTPFVVSVNGNTHLFNLKSECVKSYEECEDTILYDVVRGSYGFVIANTMYNKKFVQVYDLISGAIFAQYDLTGASVVSILENGNIFVQYHTLVEDDGADYDYTENGEKYTLETAIINIETGEKTEIETDYKVESVRAISDSKVVEEIYSLADIPYEATYKDTVINIAYARKIENKHLLQGYMLYIDNSFNVSFVSHGDMPENAPLLAESYELLSNGATLYDMGGYQTIIYSDGSFVNLPNDAVVHDPVIVTENKVYDLKLNVIANRNDYGYDYLENDNDEYFQRKLMYKGTTGNSAIFYSYERYTDGYTDDDKPIYKFEYRYYRVYKSGDSYSIQEIYDWDSEKEDSIVKIESGYVIANNKNGKYVLYNSNFEHVYTTENPMTVKNFGDQYWFETYSEFEHKNVIYKLN